TDVTADIAAGPVVNDDGWWRLVERRLDRHVGCHGRSSTQQGDKRNADESEVSHITFPNCTLDLPPTGISIFQKAPLACSRSATTGSFCGAGMRTVADRCSEEKLRLDACAPPRGPGKTHGHKRCGRPRGEGRPRASPVWGRGGVGT